MSSKFSTPFSQDTVKVCFPIFFAGSCTYSVNTALQDINDEFLAGYISLVDGEKDPRNLMLVFSMDRVICIEFDISRHVDVRLLCLLCKTHLILYQELFNVIYCYFPITFKTPEDDPRQAVFEDIFSKMVFLGVASLLVSSVVYHAKLGLQTVIEDYQHDETKVVLMIAMNFVYGAAWLLAVFSILKIAFTGTPA